MIASAIVLVAMMTGRGRAQGLSDETPPALVAFGFTPATIDTGAAGGTVAVTAQVADAQSGVASVYVQFRHASGAAHGVALTRTAGTAADGTYEATFAFPQLSAAGDWTILVVLDDVRGNHRALSSDDLAVLGFPATLANTAASDDHAPPTLAAFSFTPSTIDTGGTGTTVTVTAHVSDANGVSGVYAQFRHVSGERHGLDLSLTNGTAADGTYEGVLAFPQLSAAGDWMILVVVRDALGNRRDLYSDDLEALGFTATLPNTATTDDHAAPALVAFSFAPTTIDSGSSSAPLTVTAHVTDGSSGVANVYVQFRHAGGAGNGVDLARTAGTAADGTYEGSFSFPTLSPAGDWSLLVIAEDELGNRRDLYSDDLEALGFATTLTNAPTAPAVTPTPTTTPTPAPTATGTPGVGLGLVGDRVLALLTVGGDLYVGGEIESAGGVSATGIAKWNGVQWSEVGGGIQGEVYALATNGTDVYAGGAFSFAGGVPANRVAKWDGVSWSAMGSGFADTVTALAVIGDQLYATGRDQIDQSHVARWNGTNWVGLQRVDSPLDAIVGFQGSPYIVGDFDTIVRQLARWDGSAWNLFAPSLNGNVSSFAVSGNSLFAGGRFTNLGGALGDYIARWDGSSWNPLGGTDDWVEALGFVDADLYAGGFFSSAGGVSANFVARWDGVSWHALGTGLDNAAYALTGFGGDVVVGGEFIQAGGQPANLVARWDGTSWHPLVNLAAVCGNGIVEGAEACDLGAANGGASSCCTAVCQLRATGEVCRGSLGVCDLVETCSGASPTCPADAKSAAVCRPAANGCDVVEVCDGVVSTCPADDIGDGGLCNDGNACTLGDVCSGGNCIGGSTLDCNDGNACTNDACNPATGCTHVNNAAPCEDGLFCTVSDACAGGTCTAGGVRDCGGGADQCNAGICDELHDQCGRAPVGDGATCDDGNGCTGGDSCRAGQCLGVSTGCGDGVVNGTCGEQCDDAKPGTGDGCSATCAIESGWACTGQPSLCRVTCGDGTFEPMVGESCDDGDLGDGDGCGSTCAVESGWTCSGAPGATSVCTPICGDGLRVGAEQCDVGDADDGDSDGCEANCTITPKALPVVTAIPGETVRSDVEDDGATALDPLETAVTIPTGGEVQITRRPASGTGAAGYGLLGQEVVITAPPATAADPLRFVFTLDPSLAPGVTPADVPVFRNGVLVPSCAGPAGQASPDPCVESRTLLANGEDIAIAVLTSAASVWRFAVDVCGNAPELDCRAPIASGKASLQIKNASDAAKDSLQWKWSKGAATTAGDLGDPTAATDYTLCVYDANGLALRLAVPPGGTCGTKPCWTAKTGSYAYKDKLGAADGVVQLQLKAGVPAGRAKIALKGKGAALGLPPALGLAAPVTAQLRSADTCWQAIYSAPAANDQGQFKAKSD